MFQGKRKLLAAALAMGLAAFVAFGACGGDDDDENGDGGNTPSAGTTPADEDKYADLSGEIVVDGSSTVGPITSAVAEEFGKVSDVDVAVAISGTGGGFEKFCKGEIDINDASRPIKEDDDKEGAACESAGIEYVEFRVAIDGLTVVVNPENDFAQCISYSQLKSIWGPGSGVSRWNQLDPSWPDEEIRLFSPGADSGTFDYFTEEVNGKAKDSRNDSRVTFSEDDNVLVQGVENTDGALGYFGFAYYAEAGEGLRALAVTKDQNGKGTPTPAGDLENCVEPTEATVNDGSYPLSRPLYIYVSKEALARPEVQGFVEYYLDNAPELVQDVGYVPFPDSVYSEEMNKLATSR